jgi:hypothetical protein
VSAAARGICALRKASFRKQKNGRRRFFACGRRDPARRRVAATGRRLLFPQLFTEFSHFFYRRGTVCDILFPGIFIRRFLRTKGVKIVS